MADELLKLTPSAFWWLKKNVEHNRPMYEDPNADFGTLLEKKIPGYSEPTGVKITGKLNLDPPSADSGRKQHTADKQALEFYSSLEGMTPRLASDHHIWAYINHFYLHEYGIYRWPHREVNSVEDNIHDHWLTTGKETTKIWKASIAGRTWWIAHMASVAAKASDWTFTAQEALDAFSKNPGYYHRSMEFTVMRNPVLLAECVRSLRGDSYGLNRNGYRDMLKEINREAGARLLDSLGRKEVQRLVSRSSDRVMRIPEYVPDRNNLKGVKTYKVLSLGAGVQSTVMALMAERGWRGMEKPDLAIFADTQWEPPEVYEHLDWLESQLTCKKVRVTAGNIRENVLSGVTPDGNKFLDMPVFLINEDGKNSVAVRQCTNHYKIRPIHKYLREELKLEHGKRAPKNIQVEMWMGISTDEAHRMKESRDEWITNKFPLIEMGLSRAQLKEWFEKEYPGRNLPRSACVGCPYHTNMEWKWLKENDPKSFEDAVFIDKAIREIPNVRGTLRGEGYLHRDRVELDKVDFSKVDDYDDFMASECEGMCGV